MSLSTIKSTKSNLRPTKTQINLHSQCLSLLGAKLLHLDNKDSDHTAQLCRLIWVFAGHSCDFVGFVVPNINILIHVKQESCFLHTLTPSIIWDTAQQNQQNDLCAQQRLKSSLGICPVWSESLLCPLWVATDPKALKQTVKNLIRLGGWQGWSVFAGRTSFCWFCHAAAHRQWIQGIGKVKMLITLPIGIFHVKQNRMRHDMTKPTKWLHARRRLRSAWASAQSDQSSLSACRKLRVLSYPLSAQRRLWSDWADAQADLLSLRWAHRHFFGFVMSGSDAFVVCTRFTR